ncbi:SAV_915 family protein [Actinoplanes sp. NPDC024001]|uniref:SAV_915 family protein n=1 Tax=Actinoplanes sp. NPDC024001 TaxID=3154598 RepID=UPI0033DBECAE
MRRTEDGRIALLIYSALDRLVDCCGEQQPWTVVPATDLDRIQQLTGYELIYMDMRIPEQLRRDGEQS